MHLVYVDESTHGSSFALCAVSIQLDELTSTRKATKKLRPARSSRLHMNKETRSERHAAIDFVSALSNVTILHVQTETTKIGGTGPRWRAVVALLSHSLVIDSAGVIFEN